ncbi:YybH family protein [Methylocaldum marinum]|jgi:ketosteroid isomerase-like protein|nr:nuclear transport factor 2 family protein [Methylocaldum marinum]
MKIITGADAGCTLNSAAEALNTFYRAFNQKDITLMETVWLPSDEPSMDNPIGGIRRGWPEIRGGYEKLFASGVNVYVEFYDYTLQEQDSFALAVGRERGYCDASGERVPLEIRTSRLFVRRDGKWRQMHHHGSVEYPSLLASYQKAVLGQVLELTRESQ